MREKTKKVMRPLGEIMSDNSKCHLYIPQLRKDIYVLNIIVQGFFREKRCEGKGP